MSASVDASLQDVSARSRCRSVAGQLVVLAALGAFIAVVFGPLLGADFFMDDVVHLYDLSNYGLAKLLLSPQGGHPRFVSNAAYALLRSLFGLEPTWWFAVVLVLHTTNAVLLFRLMRALECRPLVAFTATGLWALSPVQSGALGWFACIGHVLIGTIVLVVLRDMVLVFGRDAPVSPRRALCWYALALAAANSYAIGAGIAGALWLVAAVLRRRDTAGTGAILSLATLVLVVPALYVAQHAVYWWLFRVPLFYESAVTTASVGAMIRAVAPAFRALLDLVVYGVSALVLGAAVHTNASVAADTGPFRGVPIDALLVRLRFVALPCLVAVVAVLRGDPRRRARHALALGVVALAAYGAIAWGSVLAGRVNAMEERFGATPATAYAAQAVMTRHHYAATVVLGAILALAADSVAAHGSRARTLVHVAACVVIVAQAAMAPAARAVVAGDVRRNRFLVFHHQVLEQIERAVEKAPPGATVYLLNRQLGPPVFDLHAGYVPGWAAVGVIYHPDGLVHGRTIRFVEPDSALRAMLREQSGTPIARLVVAPEDVPETSSPSYPEKHPQEQRGTIELLQGHDGQRAARNLFDRGPFPAREVEVPGVRRTKKGVVGGSCPRIPRPMSRRRRNISRYGATGGVVDVRRTRSGQIPLYRRYLPHNRFRRPG